MKNISTQISELLQEAGADLSGFADLSGIPEAELPRGISVAVKLPRHIVREIQNGPTAAYHEAYHDINRKLDALVTEAAEVLIAEGYKAQALTRSRVVSLPENRTRLPPKTVAVRSALGWIGKNNLLITPQFGGAVRISSVLTDAPLKTADHLLRSMCGYCDICRQACPAGAIYGNHWLPESDRDDMFRMSDCEDMANRLSGENFGVPDAGICGICFARCPYTQRYLNEFPG
jgi:epoxyqueuosine reductase QueG